MAFQQSDLDRIDAAIASGIRKITFADGRSTEYQNAADMVSARNMIEKAIANGSTRGRRRLIIARVGRL